MIKEELQFPKIIDPSAGPGRGHGIDLRCSFAVVVHHYLLVADHCS